MAIGGLGSIALAGLLTTVRDSLLSANVALVLMVVVVIAAAIAAAIGGRAAGAVSAGIATLSFDFFYTKPYNSLRMSSWDDVETAMLLLLGGLIVGQLAVRARASRAAADAGRAAGASPGSAGGPVQLGPCGVGASIEQRVVAVAFADQVGAAFEADSPSVPDV